MPIKDKEVNRSYQREWARRKRNGIRTSGIHQRNPPSKEELDRRRIRRNQKATERKYKKKEKLDVILGTACILCGSEHSLVVHEKNGEPHNGVGGNMWIDAFERPQDFVRLCYSCHKGVHWAMKWFNMTWDEIISTIESNKH
jgi:hypothetical protein